MQARQIILLRHAHASAPDPHLDDHDRALSVRGQMEADAAGRWLREHDAQPVRVVCSSAARARETCERVLATIGYSDLREEPRVFEASPATLLRILDEHADASPLLMVGHNPGFEQLLALLTTGSSGAGRGMPPASIVWLELGGAGLEPGSARVLHFWWP